MKKISRILSVFLVIVTMFSVCSMMTGAISASSKKEDMLLDMERIKEKLKEFSGEEA